MTKKLLKKLYCYFLSRLLTSSRSSFLSNSKAAKSSSPVLNLGTKQQQATKIPLPRDQEAAAPTKKLISAR